MKLSAWKHRLLGLGLSCAAALIAPALARGQESGVQVADEENPPATFNLVLEGIEGLRGLKPSSHWIGVVVRPCDDLIRTHLKFEGGLIVDDVTPDSPAAKAGIEKHDILLALNDASVADLKGLMDFLTENKEKVIVVKVLHAGEAKTIELTPAQRPEEQFKYFPSEAFKFELPEAKMPEELQRWMKEFAHDPEKRGEWHVEGEPYRARFFHPGVLLGDKAKVWFELATGDLPENLQVLIHKEGDKPAKITVKRGEEAWEVTEEELDKLPEDVRRHVMKFLGPADRLGIRVEPPKAVPPTPRVKIFAAPPIALPEPVRDPVRVEARAIRVGGPDLEKKLDEINGRLEKIEKALEKLSEQ